MRFVELALSALGPDRTASSSSAPTAITAAACGCRADAEITGIELDLDHIRRVETIAWAPIRPLACQRTSAAATSRAIPARTATRTGPSPGPRGAAEQPAGRFAVDPGHRRGLPSNSRCFSVRVAPWFRSRCLTAYSRGWLGHRHLMAGFGNSDFEQGDSLGNRSPESIRVLDGGGVPIVVEKRNGVSSRWIGDHQP